MPKLRIVTKLIRDILSIGYAVNVWDTEAFALNAPSDNLQVILNHLGETDEETLCIYKAEALIGEVALIYDPDDDPASVICDYHVSIGNLTAGAEALAEALETQPNNTRLITLIENAPVWAHYWVQNQNGTGYYWEHKPRTSGVTGVWTAGSPCWKPGHKCQSKRFDLPTSTPWIETLIEIKK